MPNLLTNTIQVRDQKKIQAIDLNNTMEVIMMKRMNFIRNSLESHDPKYTTSQIRQIANTKRDQRVLELWKKDLETPKVTDIIGKFRSERQSQGRNDFEAFEQ